MCVDRAGVVGRDGETHQGVFDLSFFSMIPNIIIMAPKNFKELEKMLEYAIKLNKPVMIRYPRGGEGSIKFDTCDTVELGRAEVLKTGNDLTIIAIGKMVERGVEIANILEEQGKSIEVINARFLKPIDKETLSKSIIKTKNVITIEDNILRGGLGDTVEEIINELNTENNIKLKKYGYPDEFIKHGSVEEIEKKYKLNTESIVKSIEDSVLKDKIVF